MYNTLIELAKKVEHVYIVGHVNPDGDCIGACIALNMLLEKEHVKAKTLLVDIPDTYNFLPIEKFVIDTMPEQVDLLITLDCGDITRLGKCEVLTKKAGTVFNIDHHVSNTKFGDYNLVDGDASSTCEVIYNMLEDMTLLNKEISKALYTGIIYDTGVFKHSCTSENTHIVAGRLISYGIDFTEIINQLFYYKSLKGLKTYSKAMAYLELYNEEKIALTYLKLSDLEQFGATKKHTERIVQEMNEIRDIECAILIIEIEPKVFKVSLRSRGLVNVCKVAKAYNGGGHVKASGFTIEGDLESVINEVLRQVDNQLSLCN